jgi:hypothetical protein
MDEREIAREWERGIMAFIGQLPIEQRWLGIAERELERWFITLDREILIAELSERISKLESAEFPPSLEKLEQWIAKLERSVEK